MHTRSLDTVLQIAEQFGGGLRLTTAQFESAFAYAHGCGTVFQDRGCLMNIERRKFLITDLHPEVRGVFSALAEDLVMAYQADKTEFLLEPFEGLRSPDRQAHLLSKGTTKVGPWKSAHQYGLAVDFVPRRLNANGISEWHWPPTKHNDWEVLSELAAQHGLRTPISWDRPHVEHPYWRQVRNVW
ncbi:putative endolysin [Microvirus sp.]|nr:putative endolysin [Microvirus sp.]